MIYDLRQILALFSDKFRVGLPHDLVHAVWLMEVAMSLNDDEIGKDFDSDCKYSFDEVHSISGIDVRFTEVEDISGARASISYDGVLLFEDDFDSVSEAKAQTLVWISKFVSNFVTLHERISATEGKGGDLFRIRRIMRSDRLKAVLANASNFERKSVGFSDDDIPW
jgi:hypothetical protein